MRFFSLISLGVAALGLCGCDRASTEAKAAGKAGKFAVPVETTKAKLERVEDRIFAVGSLAANEMVQIKSEIAGRVAEVLFDEGASVHKGDVLFRLDDGKLQAALQSAQARLDKARNNLERNRKLLEQQTISPQEFDDAQAEFKETDAAVALAKERLADATIRAPFDSYISERLVSPGQYVDEGQTLVTLVDNDPMKLDFSVPERYLSRLLPGQTVNVKVVSLAGNEFEGQVYFVDPRADPSTRTVKVKAHIPNPDGALRAGLFANVELVTGVRDNAVVVPEQAVVPVIDKLTVFVVENGVARRREITVGARLPGKIEIAGGIETGEAVVIAGQQKLSDGVPVQPVEKL